MQVIGGTPKAQRLLDIINMLIQAKSVGISKRFIIDEYAINEKTFKRDKRDLPFLAQFMNFKYDYKEKRLYGFLK